MVLRTIRAKQRATMGRRKVSALHGVTRFVAGVTAVVPLRYVYFFWVCIPNDAVARARPPLLAQVGSSAVIAPGSGARLPHG